MRARWVLLAVGAASSALAGRPANMETRSPTGLPPSERIKPLTARLRMPRAVYTALPTRAPAGTTVEIPPPRDPILLTVAGTENLAAGRPVTASSAPVRGTLAQVTDGDKDPDPGSAVELGTGTRSVVIDLGEEADLAGIVVWHEHAAPVVYHDVVVQAAADSKFGRGTVTLFNTDTRDEAGFGRGSDHEYFEYYTGKLIPARGVHARYIRVASRGSTAGPMNRLTEVEVWGVPHP